VIPLSNLQPSLLPGVDYALEYTALDLRGAERRDPRPRVLVCWTEPLYMANLTL
jgi:hypothetical protein